MSVILWSCFVGIAVFFILHLGIWALWPSNTPRIFLLWMFAGSGVFCSLGIQVLYSGIDIPALWSVAAFDVFVITAYTFIYAGVSRSVSLTLLSQLLGEERIRFSDLAAQYNESSRFDDRIALMQTMGWLQQTSKPGEVALTATGNCYAMRFRQLSHFFRTHFQG